MCYGIAAGIIVPRCNDAVDVRFIAHSSLVRQVIALAISKQFLLTLCVCVCCVAVCFGIKIKIAIILSVWEMWRSAWLFLLGFFSLLLHQVHSEVTANKIDDKESIRSLRIIFVVVVVLFIYSNARECNVAEQSGQHDTMACNQWKMRGLQITNASIDDLVRKSTWPHKMHTKRTISQWHIKRSITSTQIKTSAQFTSILVQFSKEGNPLSLNFRFCFVLSFFGIQSSR